MSSLNAILNIAGSAVSTYQSAISVTGQNIANVDSENYSIQTAVYTPTNSVSSGGVTYGTGVAVDTVSQAVNQILENLLTSEMSSQAALEEEAVYMTLIENLFAEDTDGSLNTLLDNYWTSWEDLSNNPSGTTEQKVVYEAGISLAQGIVSRAQELEFMVDDLNREISSGVTEVNTLAAELAALNQTIMQTESSGGNANDLNDRRNALVDDLGGLIDIDITVKDDGSYLILTTGGLPLVEDGVAYSLAMDGDQVCWCGNSGTTHDITDDISGGALAGWLEIRDAVIPETLAELDELATVMIWTMNYQHSQGAGQTYFSGPVEGTYSAGDSGVLSSLVFGDEIDYSKDFSMVIQGSSGYQTVSVDMGISGAQIWGITGSGQADSTYEITVVDEGVLGEQTVVQSSGDNLGGITSSDYVADALDAALAEQTLTITTAGGTQEILISDDGSGAARSAADIAEELSGIDGITAYSSATEASIGLDGITEAQDGDIVSFTLYVDGLEEETSFTVDSSEGTLVDQFETALTAAAEAINETNRNTDLMTDGCTIQSASGATIGVQDFEVTDNAGVTLDNFQDFDEGDTITITLATDASTPEEVTVTIDLTDVDTSDSGQVAQAFYDALDEQLEDTPFTTELDETTGQLTLRTTDGTGISLSAAAGDTGDDASVSVTALDGSTASGDGLLDFNGTDLDVATADTDADDYITFSLPGCEESTIGSATAIVGETGGAYDTAAVLTGSVTILIDPDVEISSDTITSAGFFGTSGSSGDGNSMITLGGTDGYGNFDDGDTISFQVGGYDVSYTVAAAAAGQLTDAEQASQLHAALTAALPADGYEVVMNGTSVSIVRTAEADDPLSITGFSDVTGLDATLAVSTGTGIGTEAPENDVLVSGDALYDGATAATYGDSAMIFWEELDQDGYPTGDSGYVEIDEPGLVEITQDGETLLSFTVSEGSLTAGNTMRINTDADGEPDPLDLSVSGTAASIDDTYEFTVTSGGSVPDNDEPLEIEWSSGSSSGTLVLEGNDSEDASIAVEVDGMTLYFNDGTLVEGDVFYVTTDDSGQITTTDDDGNGAADTLSDWHWTQDSFAEEFNRSAGGVTATITEDNTLVFDSTEDYCAVESVSYSGADGISEDNAQITILNYTALDVAAEDLQFVRTDGSWEVENDPTGGTIQILPEGGDDDGFMVDLDGDGVGDIEILFDQAVTGDGSIQMELSAKEADDFSFAFAGDEDGDSGLTAALGINTFFTGSDAESMGVNEILADGDYLASGMVDTETGELSSGDNTNALAMADTRYESLEMKDWDYTRGESASATVSETTLDDYEETMIAAIGITSQMIQSSLDAADQLVYQFTSQRDSISAVSLDEEMIKLTAQQAAYNAAAKLLTVVDEMFDALLAIR